MRFFGCAVTIAFVLSVFPVDDSRAQELNTRADAPPGAKATIGRLMPKSRVQATKQGKNLSKDIVNTDCKPVRIGNVNNDDRGRRPADNAVVIRGNVVNLCR